MMVAFQTIFKGPSCLMWMMARRAALQSELSRCEAELRMLGSDRSDTTKKPDILESLALFSKSMKEVSSLSSNVYAKRAFEIWSRIIDSFLSEINWVESIPNTTTASERDVVKRDNYTRLDTAVRHVYNSMNIIVLAYFEIEDEVMLLFKNACEGLMPGGELVSASKYNTCNKETCLEWVEIRFQQMGRRIRMPYCEHDELYKFLGEKAEKKMTESFRILDPDHGDLHTASPDPRADA